MLSEQRSEVIRAGQSWSEAGSLFVISPVVIGEGEQSLSAVCHLAKPFQVTNLGGAGLLTQWQVYMGDLV